MEGVYLENTARDEKFQVLPSNFKQMFYYKDYLILVVMPCSLV